jgi:hypothetical protein
MENETQGVGPEPGEKGGMETIVVRLGVKSAMGDFRRSFRFRGKELASTYTYEGAYSRDDRGKDYTLYAVRGGFRVLVCSWSRWQGEVDRYYMIRRNDDFWEEPDWKALKGDVLSASEVAMVCPAVWNVAVKAGTVEDVPEDLE